MILLSCTSITSVYKATKYNYEEKKSFYNAKSVYLLSRVQSFVHC